MYLPSVNRRGFTLVELMVVVAIIAILAVVGITVFSNTQKSARDSRRQADVVAIATALENKKTANSPTYSQITATDFSAGAIPVDTTTAKYCIATSITLGAVSPGKPTAWANSVACPTAPAGYVVVDGTTNPVNNTTAWTVCALLENGTAPNVYCRSNSQ